jgi:hypothetical protein
VQEHQHLNLEMIVIVEQLQLEFVELILPLLQQDAETTQNLNVKQDVEQEHQHQTHVIAKPKQ